MKKKLFATALIMTAITLFNCGKPSPSSICQDAKPVIAQKLADPIGKLFETEISLTIGTDFKLSDEDYKFLAEKVITLELDQAAYNKAKDSYICNYKVTFDGQKFVELPSIKKIAEMFPAVKKDLKIDKNSNGETKTVYLTVEFPVDENNKPMITESGDELLLKLKNH